MTHLSALCRVTKQKFGIMYTKQCVYNGNIVSAELHYYYCLLNTAFHGKLRAAPCFYKRVIFRNRTHKTKQVMQELAAKLTPCLHTHHHLPSVSVSLLMNIHICYNHSFTC